MTAPNSVPDAAASSSADAEPVLEAHDLVKHYPTGQGLRRNAAAIHALDGVDVTLRRGSTLGIVGESGCGKSTLARLLALVERPSSGDLRILGQTATDLTGSKLRRFRRHTQMVFQNPYGALDPRLPIAEIIAEPLKVHRDLVPRGERADKVAELLGQVGLNPADGGKYPHQFSGGQRQRVGIARVLAMHPELVVCDEPVSSLDVSVQAQIVNLLAEVQHDLGLSYIFISHDLTLVHHIADHISVMYLGMIVETGTAHQVYARPSHPYTQALLSAEPHPTQRRSGSPTGRERIVLHGEVPSPVNPPTGCRFRTRCWRAEEICARSRPELVLREGADHPVACHFPEVPAMG